LSATSTTEFESSTTMTAPEPSIEPAFAIESKSKGRSRCSFVRTGEEEPPGNQKSTSRPSGGPPARS